MTEKEREQFYITAALRYDVDSCLADELLELAGMEASTAGAGECMAVITRHWAVNVACHLARRLQPNLSPTLSGLGTQK